MTELRFHYDDLLMLEATMKILHREGRTTRARVVGTAHAELSRLYNEVLPQLINVIDTKDNT